MDSANPRTIFITGATGLVGGHAAEEALRRGHRVKALVRASSDTRWLDHLGVEKVPGDLEDAESLRRGVAGADWVFNCAAKVGDWGTLAEFRRLNVDALRLLLDAACDAHVERLVHVSSLGVYEGRDHHGTDETVPTAASSLDAYTRSKTEAEAMVLKYHKERSLPVAIVRPGFIYGERDRTVLPKLLLNLRRGTFAYFGSGEQALNCIYVKNLVHGIFLAAESPAALGEVFNLTDGEPVSKIRFVSRVAELAGLRPPTRHIPLGLARSAGHGGRGRRRSCEEPGMPRSSTRPDSSSWGCTSTTRSPRRGGFWATNHLTASMRRSSVPWPSTDPERIRKPLRTPGRQPDYRRIRPARTCRQPIIREEQHDEQPEGQARRRAGREVL